MGIVAKKILCLSTGDVNGAYEYLYKLSYFLKMEGFEVALLVKTKTRSDSFIKQYQFPATPELTLFKKLWRRIALKFSNKNIASNPVFDGKYSFISVNEKDENVSAQRIVQQIGFTPDYIFSGMTSHFMNSTDILNLQVLTNAEVYNITVDMNHFTGGCHYAWDCTGYIRGCDTNCPAILSETGRDIAAENFRIKYKNAQKGNFKIIAGSGWTVKQAKESKIYRDQKNIPNLNSLIDTEILNANNREIAKNVFGLDKNKFYILMGCQSANDPRKGFEYLLNALQILEQKCSEAQKSNISVLIVSRENATGFEEIPFGKTHIDFIKDYRLLSLLYQSADVFVNSSVEDSGPMMVSEALACGTPVVGFNMGVVTNMVVTGYNGYVANLKDSVDLANGIFDIFTLSSADYKGYSKNAVKQVEEFSAMPTVIKELFFLYEN